MASTHIAKPTPQRIKAKERNTKKSLAKILMGFIALICLLLSSCVIKSQLKRYLGFSNESIFLLSSSNTTKKTNQSEHQQTALTSTFNFCQLHAPSTLLSDGAHIGQGAQRLLGHGFTLFLSSTFLLLMAGLPSPNDLLKRQCSENWPQPAAMPLFIRHRRLLI
jgi:hypothetical protein